jgi:acyl-CoA synthetase (AMP-forming)/AMP-acid ligase II
MWRSAVPEVAPASVNIAAHLARMAAERPHATAVVCPDGRDRRGRARYVHLTYRQLDEASAQIARGLMRIGVGPGVRTVLMVSPSLEMYELVFALFRAGAVPVLVDPGIGLTNLKRCLGNARPEAFIGVAKANMARLVLGWSRRTIRTTVTVGRRRLLAGRTLTDVVARGEGRDAPMTVADEDIAAILFTSGSTGTPKGVIYGHGNFQAQVAAIGEMLGIEPGEVDCPTFPLFGLFDPALGMTTVVPDMDPTRPAKVDPRRIVEAVHDFGVTNMFGSPALLNTVGRYGEVTGAKLPSLRRVTSAGAPVPARIIERFLTMLPEGAEVFTPYGATESLPVALIGSNEVLGETRHATDEGRGVCVGRPVASIDV